MNYVIAFLLYCGGLWLVQRAYDKHKRRREMARRKRLSPLIAAALRYQAHPSEWDHPTYQAHPVKFPGWSIEREDWR
jgi:hypothetical protein